MAFEIQLVKVNLMFTCGNSSQMKDMFIIITVINTNLPMSNSNRICERQKQGKLKQEPRSWQDWRDARWLGT